MTQITKEAIEVAKSAYWHEAHNGGGYSDKCYEAALTAALPFLSTLPIAGEGKVKALYWARENPYYTARTGFGHYSIERVDSPIPYFELKGSSIWPARKFWKFAEAKAFAQADYETRILSALISSPGKDGGQEVEELRREIASLQYRLDEANGHLLRFEEGQEVEAKRWLVEETLPSGSVRWSVFEHEHQAKLEAANGNATVTPLYTRPQPATTALVEAARDVITSASDTFKKRSGRHPT